MTSPPHLYQEEHSPQADLQPLKKECTHPSTIEPYRVAAENDAAADWQS